MLGAIAGGVVGSVYEASPVKLTDFELFSHGSRFTDDTVLTVATAEAVLGDGNYAGAYRRYGRAYPHAGYGGSFYRWLLEEDAGPSNSWGNGAAMRVSPMGFALDTVCIQDPLMPMPSIMVPQSGQAPSRIRFRRTKKPWRPISRAPH
jgi:ADP-ribosylglycohydrolase